MVIIPTILIGVLLIDAVTKGINEGLPTWESPICLRPIEVIYILPRIVAPFFIVYPMILVKPIPVRCFFVGVLLYLLSFGIKALFWRVCYGINVLDNKYKRWN